MPTTRETTRRRQYAWTVLGTILVVMCTIGTWSTFDRLVAPCLSDIGENFDIASSEASWTSTAIITFGRRRQRRLKGGHGGSSNEKDQPARGDERRSYSQYVGYHSRDRNGMTEAERAFYGYPEDEATREPTWWELKYEQTDLLDVLMCWVLAVAWSSWMLGSFVKSELLRYGQDSITVKGNVRMVTLDEASLGTGIPIYKAVIDYIIPAHMCNGGYGNPAHYPPSGGGTHYPVGPSTLGASNAAASSMTNSDTAADDTTARPALQIRKEFETLHPLQQGFGNVELLVLHHEPTTSILKGDWEQQVLEEMEESRSRRARRSKVACCGCVAKFCRCLDGVFCGFGKDDYGEHVIWKRVWIGFCLIMMLFSMAGCVLAVHRLPRDMLRLGWLCLCLASLLVFPVALLIRMTIVSVQRRVVPQGRAGIVVSANPSFSSTPTIKNHHTQHQHPSLACGQSNAAQTDSHFCMDPSDVLDVQVCEEDEAMSLQQTREQIQHQASGEEYVVRLPPGGVNYNGSDVSDMSNNSHSVLLNPIDNGEEGSGMSNKSRRGSIVTSGVMA